MNKAIYPQFLLKTKKPQPWCSCGFKNLSACMKGTNKLVVPVKVRILLLSRYVVILKKNRGELFLKLQ